MLLASVRMPIKEVLCVVSDMLGKTCLSLQTLAVVEDETKPDNYLDGMAKVIDEPKRTFDSRDDIQPPDYMDVAETETSTTEF